MPSLTAPLIEKFPPAATVPGVEAKSTATAPLALKVITVLLFFPEETSVNIAGLRLTAIRIVFLLLAPFVLAQLGRKLAAGRYHFVLSDLFVPLAGVWMIVGPANIVGTNEALSHSGPIVLEFLLGYLATRTLLWEHGQALSLADWLCRVIAVVALLGLLDPLTHHFFIRDLASKLTGYTKGFSEANYDVVTRLGVLRAASSLEHPIAFGLICTIGLLLSAYLPIRARRFTIVSCLVGAIISITSAAIQGIILAYGLEHYNRILSGVKFRWAGLVSLTVFGIVMIFTLIDNPLGFIFRHFIFDAESGYFRLYTWDLAGAALAQSPWFGLGFGIPEYYDIPYTVDSVWLESALMFGLPGSVLIALSILGSVSLPTNGPRVWLTTAESRLGTMLGMLIFLIVFWGFTVHYWGTDWILIALLIGIKAHLGELGRIRHNI